LLLLTSIIVDRF